MDPEKKDETTKEDVDTGQQEPNFSEETYEPPQLMKFERLEKLIVSGE